MGYMTRWAIRTHGFGLGVAALLALACNSSSEATPTSEAGGSAGCPAEGEEFETARLYIEHNATDEDTGVHGLFGGEAWSLLCITNPEGEQLLRVGPRGPLGDLGLADLFFESREPPNDEFAIRELRTRFPEGDYEVAAIDFEGNPRVGTARFTRNIPAEPEITAPTLVEEPEDTRDASVPTTGVTVRWEPVTETIDGLPVEIVAYEVIVTKEEHDDPDAFSRPVYDVHLPAAVTSLVVPPEFLETDTVYELEVLAIEASGNQTIGLGFFRTE